LLLALGIVHRSDVHAVVEAFFMAHAPQDLQQDRAIHDQVWLAEVTAGFQDS
jgi:hypothetical protein